MKYYSLNKKSPSVDFKEATIRGQAPDGGLYFPEYIPQFDKVFLKNIEDIPDHEIAFRVIHPYVKEVMPEEVIGKIVEETLSFPLPLVSVQDNIFSLELFHGPTMAFKDVGARFMSRCLGYFAGSDRNAESGLGNNRRVVVLVATSGDTGGAVADGFYDVEGVEVVILYPSGKVSIVQEKQLTTHGKNIHALEVKGSFDDCQKMVKQAFSDEDLSKKILLTSANSINVARWLPQQFYYLLAWKQWKQKDQPPVICVPSGNFGNICAGMLAFASGLPVSHFIAACNTNDTVPEFLKTGEYKPKKAVATLSNAMDVADPSNFVRVLEIFQRQNIDLKKMMSSVSIGDAETSQTIKKVYEQHKYLLDPHGAVGYLALHRYLQKNEKAGGYFLETAHPVKFADSVERFIGEAIPYPEAIETIMKKEKKAEKIGTDYETLQEYLGGMKGK